MVLLLGLEVPLVELEVGESGVDGGVLGWLLGGLLVLGSLGVVGVVGTVVGSLVVGGSEG